jgi:mRNA interferase MazF
VGLVKRSQVWWVDFGEPIGSEPGYRRPALVVSSDRFNRSRISTVIVAPITSNLRLADAPGNVTVQADEAGLDKMSVVNVSQILVIDRYRLQSTGGSITPQTMREVDAGLRLVLSL